MLSLLLAAVAAATFVNQPPVVPPTTQAPESGSYIGMAYVPSADGSGCVLAADSNVIAEVSFGGLSGKTLWIRYPYAASNGTVASVQTLTLTGGLGSVTPNGTFTWTGSGTHTWDVSGTFTANVTEVGTHAFMITVVETFTDCTETQSLSLARVGVDNN